MDNQIKITRLQEQVKAIKDEVSQTRVEVKEGFVEVKAQIAGITNKLDCYVTKETYNKDLGDLNSKLGKQSGNWDWVVKSVMGIVIGALLALVIKGI